MAKFKQRNNSAAAGNELLPVEDDFLLVATLQNMLDIREVGASVPQLCCCCCCCCCRLHREFGQTVRVNCTPANNRSTNVFDWNSCSCCCSCKDFGETAVVVFVVKVKSFEIRPSENFDLGERGDTGGSGMSGCESDAGVEEGVPPVGIVNSSSIVLSK